MGIQSLVTPALASGNSVFNDQMAAIVTTCSCNGNLGITAFWARPYNDNYPGWDKDGLAHYRAGYLDNIDAFGILLPITVNGSTLTPWGLGAVLGPNSLRGAVGENGYPFGNIANLGAGYSDYGAGMFPVGGARHSDFANASTAHDLVSNGSAWWLGITGSISLWESFRLAFDYEYGSVAWADNARLNRSGWFATLLLEYAADWGTPALYGWYGSGDDGNPANGSERLPALIPSNSNNYSWFAYDGAPWIERNAVIGNNMAGTWGAGIRISRFSLLDHLTQTMRINLMGGTSSPGMAKKMSLAGLWSNGVELDFNTLGPGADLGLPGIYLTTRDQALELGSNSNYKVFDNFTICLEADYVFLWLDASDSVWGARHREGRHIPAMKDAWNVNASFAYSF